MAIQSSVTVSSQAASAAIPVDYMQVPFNVGAVAVVAGGSTLTFNVEYTYDNVYTVAAPTWIAPTAFSGKSATTDGAINQPVRAVRLNVTAFTSGSVTLTVLQGSQA